MIFYYNTYQKMEKLEDHFVLTSTFINKYTYDQLLRWGVNEKLAEYLNLIVLIFITAITVYLVHFVAKKIIRLVLNWFSGPKKTFLFHLKNNRFSYNLAQIAPVILIDSAIPVVFDKFPGFINPFNKLLNIYIIFMVIKIVISICKAFGEKLKENEDYNRRPIASYVQVVQIILYLLGAIAVFSQLTGKDPVAFFSVMGAASAVLLLMFKDTIMGFVASIQVTVNDMVRIGDWIEMPKYGADGDVIDINLTTVKVQNWDKTITTVPTHTLISDSFKNWRGMREFGGRRLKRSLIIKQSSIKYISDEELERYKGIQGIREYILLKKTEIDLHNQNINADRSIPVNGRNLTNAGLFRKYATWYIENHPGVHKEKTMMVRQLSPTENGLPFEFYLFTNTVAWLEYESISGDIFDHLIASVKYFDLEIFELPTGRDLSKVCISND